MTRAGQVRVGAMLDRFSRYADYIKANRHAEKYGFQIVRIATITKRQAGRRASASSSPKRSNRNSTSTSISHRSRTYEIEVLVEFRFDRFTRDDLRRHIPRRL